MATPVSVVRNGHIKQLLFAKGIIKKGLTWLTYMQATMSDTKYVSSCTIENEVINVIFLMLAFFDSLILWYITFEKYEGDIKGLMSWN